MTTPASETPARSRPEADLILRNGPIWCGREQGLVAALAIWRDRVLATGPDADIAALPERRSSISAASSPHPD